MKHWTILAVTALTLLGALLRLEALTVKYGWLEHPAWAVRLERTLLPVSRAVHPEVVPWARVERPYVGGDPINYLRFAREMRHFYQAHVREPVFLALTRGMLWVMRGSDIAVSYASALAGSLAIVATYLLGAAAWSRGAGVIGAAALALELDAVTWAADGWRDDTFMLFVTLSAWALVRLFQRRTLGWGVIAGVCIAAACLTRISSLSFAVPALLWIAVRSKRVDDGSTAAAQTSRDRLARWSHAARPAIAAAIAAAVLVAPFLINCWRTTGDPFFAINYHTRYYRAAEGLPSDESVGALGYVARKLREKPVGTLDTAGVGLLVFPFTNKWSGFDAWSPHLASLLRWSAAAGLVLALWSAEGRLLWLILVTSLLPYAVTWPLGGGSEWRFTQHVYPIYLAAAGAALVAAGRAARTVAARQVPWRAVLRRWRRREPIAFVIVLVCGWILYLTLPYFVIREALAAGETVSIGAGNRDGLFFSSEWSRRSGSGNVFVRVAVGGHVSLRVPLPLAVDHTLTLRMDGPWVADPAQQPKVTVFLNRHAVGQVRFTNDPLRVGAYRVRIPRELAGRSNNRLDLVASHTVRADESGPRFAWLPADTPVAFYLWYVRVEPELHRSTRLHPD